MVKGSKGEPEPPDEEGDELLRGVGRKIFQARKGLGLTQAQLGALVGLQQPNIFEIEHGNINVSLKALARMADALEVRVGDLLPEDPDALPTRSQMVQLIASFDRLAEVVAMRTSRDAEMVQALQNVTRLRAALSHFLGSSDDPVVHESKGAALPGPSGHKGGSNPRTPRGS